VRSHRSWLGFLGTLPLAILPAPAGAQPVGSEFQINTYTTFNQRAPSIASDASGNFVVAWGGGIPGIGGDGIFGQRYDSAGVPRGSEFQVNTFGSNNYVPSVASDPSGNFVVVWTNRGDGSSYGVAGQRYDSAGVAQGDEFQINSYTTFGQGSPSVASAANGNLVVAWMSQSQDDSDYYSYGIFGQRYDSGGVALGDEFQIDSHTTQSQRFPSVASDASGNFIVVWSGRGPGDGYGIFGQRYDSAGVAQGAEFKVNSYTTHTQRVASVASDADGNFVVVWASDRQDGNSYGVFGQRYDSAGAAQGHEFRINSYTTQSQRSPSVAHDASGNFVVVWTSDSQDGSSVGIFGQRYDSAGLAQGGEFQINSYATGGQDTPFVWATGSNRFVVAWTSGHDGSGSGVFGQRFDFGADAIKVVSPNTNVKWRIGSQKEIRWTHNLGINATFRIKLDRNGDGDYEAVIAAAAPASGGDTGSFAWTVTGPPSGTARVRVSWIDDPAVSDSSDTPFRIKPAEFDGES
jgi:hypothetical protein